MGIHLRGMGWDNRWEQELDGNGYWTCGNGWNGNSMVLSCYTLVYEMPKRCRLFSFSGLQYIVVLFLLFVVQFIVACACLAIGPSQQKSLFRTGWREAERLRGEMQAKFDCCGAFPEDQTNVSGSGLPHPPCNSTSVCICWMFRHLLIPDVEKKLGWVKISG